MSLLPLMLRKAQIVVVGFDVTSKSTLEECANYVDCVRKHATSDVVIVGAGNKIDLADRREVTTQEGREYFAKLGVEQYYETSALTGEGVTELFEGAVRYWCAKRPEQLFQLQRQQAKHNTALEQQLAQENSNTEGRKPEHTKQKCVVM